MEELISKSEFARRMHVSAMMVTKYCRRGLPTTADGKIAWPAAQTWVTQNVRERKDHEHRHVADRPASNPSRPGVRAPDGVSLVDLQRAHEFVRIKRHQVMLDQLTRKLVPADEVEHAWSGIVTSARNRFLLLVDKLAPRVAVVSDVLQCREIIEREVRQALLDLSGHEKAL